MVKQTESPETGTLDLLDIRAFAELVEEERVLKDRLKAISAKKASMAQPIMDRMIFSGVRSVPVLAKNRRHTVFLKSTLYAKAKDDDRAKLTGVLKRCGLSDLVSEGYNANQLSAYVRNRLAEGKPLQPSLKDAIEINERIELQSTSQSREPSRSEQARKTLQKQNQKNKKVEAADDEAAEEEQ